mmetsp:Transcript_3015/g.2882  ORF Transcript_3015/g.2882 Transcript_3015/m.2882 type:complete len:210 (-) Transcript_3015:906-1535(-)
MPPSLLRLDEVLLVVLEVIILLALDGLHFLFDLSNLELNVLVHALNDINEACGGDDGESGEEPAALFRLHKEAQEFLEVLVFGHEEAQLEEEFLKEGQQLLLDLISNADEVPGRVLGVLLDFELFLGIAHDEASVHELLALHLLQGMEGLLLLVLLARREVEGSGGLVAGVVVEAHGPIVVVGQLHHGAVPNLLLSLVQRTAQENRQDR